MSYRVTQEDILAAKADAAALSVEIALDASDGRACRSLAAAGGEALRRELRKQKFLPVGSAAAAEPCGLPFRKILFTAAPRWLTGKANEMLALHRCYQSLFALADELGCRSLALPFLSSWYYRFPLSEAVRIARSEAERWSGEAVFIADTPELYELSQKPYRRPEIVSYIGWYRDHAIFELDDGRFARVDLRPEITDVTLIPYFEACYRVGNNPLQPPLPEAEIARLRRIYEGNYW